MIQSFLLRGDQIFHPVGQELACVLLDTRKPLLTLTRPPGEYPVTGFTVTTHVLGLPSAQLTASWGWMYGNGVRIYMTPKLNGVTVIFDICVY